MKKIMLLFLVCLGVQLSGQTMFFHEAQTNDARSEALGRTSLFSSSTANYLFNNPANLATIKEKKLSFGMLANFGKEGYDYSVGKDLEIDYGFNASFNGVSFATPIHSIQNYKVGFGIGYRSFYNWNYNYEYEEEFVYDDYSYVRKTENESKGSLSMLTFGGGIQINDGLSFGLALNKSMNSELETKYEEKVEYSDGNIYEDEDAQEDELSASFMVFSSTFKLNPNLTFATQIRMAYDLEIEYENDDYDKNNKYSETISYEIEIPTEYTFALMYQRTGLSIFSEFQTRHFEDYESCNYKIYDDSDNGFSLRFGMESGMKNFFRAGFFMQSVPLYDSKTTYYEYEEDEEIDEEPNLELGFTGGAGIVISNNVTVDFFGSYSFSGYEEKYENIDLDETATNEISIKRYNFGLTLNYKF